MHNVEDLSRGGISCGAKEAQHDVSTRYGIETLVRQWNQGAGMPTESNLEAISTPEIRRVSWSAVGLSHPWPNCLPNLAIETNG